MVDRAAYMREWRKRTGNSKPAAFWSRVQKSDGCWLWSGRVDKDGYGLLDFYWNGKRETRAPRIAILLSGVQLQPSQLTLHSCDNPPCVNPAHLSPGTPAINMQQKMARGRGAQVRGSAQPLSKLDATDVWEIRRLASAYQGAELAAMYGVSESCISDIKHRRTWKHTVEQTW